VSPLHRLQTLEADTLSNVGVLLRELGNLGEAELLLTQSLAIQETAQNGEGVAAAQGNLGGVKEALGKVDEAEGMYRRALALFDLRENREGKDNARIGLGNVAHRRGREDEAKQFWMGAISYFESVGAGGSASVQIARKNLAKLSGEEPLQVAYARNPSQRTPCVLVIDCSGSMSGRSIELVNAGLREFENP